MDFGGFTVPEFDCGFSLGRCGLYLTTLQGMEEHTAKRLVEAVESLTAHLDDLRSQMSTLGLQIENVLTRAVQDLTSDPYQGEPPSQPAGPDSSS